MTTKHDVIRVHRDHPDWNSVQIAAHLGCMDSYVRATFRRNGLVLPSTRRRYERGRILELRNAARKARLDDIEKLRK